MTDPVLHVLAGPNGSGKTTLYERVIAPETRLPFVNADHPAAGRSFVTETVFSHPSKVSLLTAARRAGYLVTLHVLLVPPDLSVLRVRDRVRRGGHDVPEAKVRARHRRLWTHLGAAIPLADEVLVYDNSSARTPFRVVAQLRDRQPLMRAHWPEWTPPRLRAAAG